MLITENVLRKIIAEEYEKLVNEGGFHGPLSTKLGLPRGDEGTVKYSDLLSTLKSAQKTGQYEDLNTKLRYALQYFANNDKAKLKDRFDQPGVSLRSSSNKNETDELKFQIKTIIDKL